MKVYGRNVFNELKTKKDSIKKVYISKGFSDKDIIKYIQDNNISYTVIENKKMDAMVNGKHQGIIVLIDDYKYVDYKAMLNDKIVVMLDHLEDPHNFGAIIRTCEAAGVKSLIIPKDRSVSVNETVVNLFSIIRRNTPFRVSSNDVKDHLRGYIFVIAFDVERINSIENYLVEWCELLRARNAQALMSS